MCVLCALFSRCWGYISEKNSAIPVLVGLPFQWE